MKVFRNVVLIVFILLAISFLLRGWLYRQLITYKNIGERTTYQAKSPNLIKLISLNTIQHSADSKAIVKGCLSFTSENLKFTDGKNDVDPNKLIETRNANCIGYAAFLSTVCNQMLEKNNLSNEWVATPQIGQLYFMGKNIHPYFKSAFFKDHDFVIIKNLKTGEEIGVDPTLHDYTGIEYITVKK